MTTTRYPLNVTKSEVIEGWLQYAAAHIKDERIFLAGVGLLNEQSHWKFYAYEGFAVLRRDAEMEVAK